MLMLPRGKPRLSGVTLTSAALTGLALAKSANLLLGLLAVVLVVLVVVVGPAIWSRKPHRRKAALAVLDRFFGRGGL